MWSFVLNLLGGTVKDWITSRSKIEEQKALARIENVRNGIPGWTDEFLVVVWSYPAIASFIPFLAPTVAIGIDNFNQLPEWYQYGFMTISAAVFGVDKWFKVRKK